MLLPNLIAGGAFFAAQRVGEADGGAAGFERLGLAGVGRPAGQGDDLEAGRRTAWPGGTGGWRLGGLVRTDAARIDRPQRPVQSPQTGKTTAQSSAGMSKKYYPSFRSDRARVERAQKNA